MKKGIVVRSPCATHVKNIANHRQPIRIETRAWKRNGSNSTSCHIQACHHRRPARRIGGIEVAQADQYVSLIHHRAGGAWVSRASVEWHQVQRAQAVYLNERGRE